MADIKFEIKETYHSRQKAGQKNAILLAGTENIMRSRYKKRPKAKIHLFTNVIYCADCGTGLWFLKNRNSITAQ